MSDEKVSCSYFSCPLWPEEKRGGSGQPRGQRSGSEQLGEGCGGGRGGGGQSTGGRRH